MLVNLFFETLIQWLVLLAIPILLYLIFFRKKFPFLEFFGIKESAGVPRFLIFKSVVVALLYVMVSLLWFKKYQLSARSRFLEYFSNNDSFLGMMAFLFVQEVIRTGLLEEIIFRAFLINSLKEKIGFKLANHIQALIFTAIHILAMLNFSKIDMILGMGFIYLLSLFFGELFNKSRGTILYSTLIHSGLNIIAGLLALYFSF